ncbi:unnamed protein product [Pocillopora meandrina]|uniref:Uncharacterized protein n=1 Tax=Pocillopora meandrina TaxID=46732 RepID=A0AAU9WEA8_9CNID|nr:unnamed protein product [Pocillopora meandrina]
MGINQDGITRKKCKKFKREKMKMYTAKMNGNMDNHVSEQKFDEFIEDLNILQLNDKEQSLLEEDFTINELKEALTSLADNKSPNLF